MSPVAAVKLSNEPLAPELEELFLEHSRLVYRTAYSVTGSSQDAEDVVQTLFLHLLRRGIPTGLRDTPWLGHGTGLPGFVLDPERRGVIVESRSPGVLVLWGRRASMAELAAALTRLTGTGRPVLDRTGLTGEFSFDVDGVASFIHDYRGAPQPRSLFAALEEELGVRLEPSRGEVEGLVVESAERPTEN
jgi:hypothetical protein